MFSHHQYYPTSEEAYLHQLQHRKAAIEAEERAILQRQQQQAYLRRIQQREEQERQLRFAQAEAEYRRRLYEAEQIKRLQEQEILRSHAHLDREPTVRLYHQAAQPATLRAAPQCAGFAKQSQVPTLYRSSEGDALNFVIKSLLGHTSPARGPQAHGVPRRRAVQPAPTPAPARRQEPYSGQTPIDLMTELFQAFSHMNEPVPVPDPGTSMLKSAHTPAQSAPKAATSNKAFQAPSPSAPQAEEGLNLVDLLNMFLHQTEQVSRGSAAASTSGASSSASTRASAAMGPPRPSTTSALNTDSPTRNASQTEVQSAPSIFSSANASQQPKAQQGLNLADILNMFLQSQTEQAPHSPAVASGSGSSSSASTSAIDPKGTSNSSTSSGVRSAAPGPLPATPSAPTAELSLKEQLEKRLNNEHESEIRDTIQAIFESLNISQPSQRPSSPIDVKGKGKETNPTPVSAEELEQEPTSADIMRSLSSVASIETAFRTISSEFAFPSQLDFTPPSSPTSTTIDLTSTTPSASSLAYTSRNAPVRYYAHALSGLLSQLDEIPSLGNEEVRRRRKEVVDIVEKSIEDLELEIEGRKKVWERAKGGVVAGSLKQDEPSVPVVEGIEATGGDAAAAALKATSDEVSVPAEDVNSEAPQDSTQETQSTISDAADNVKPYDVGESPEETVVTEEVAAVVQPVVLEQVAEVPQSVSLDVPSTPATDYEPELTAHQSTAALEESALVESTVDLAATVTPSTTTTPADTTISPSGAEVATPSIEPTDEQPTVVPSDSAGETPTPSTPLSQPTVPISAPFTPSLPDASTASLPTPSATTDSPLAPSFLASAFPAGEKEEQQLMKSLSQRNLTPSKGDLEDELDAVVVLPPSKTQERDNESGSEWSEVEA